MTFLEKRPEKPALHNKELHELVLSYLKDYAPGFVLDLPSGPGYLLRELKKRGFNGVAGEIDENLHFFQDIEYKKIDMSQKISFENNTFNYIVS